MMTVGNRSVRWGTLDALLTDKLRQRGDVPFAEVDGVSLTLRDIAERSRLLGLNLLRLGVKKGDRVASFMFNAPEQLILMFAAIRVGAVWTPVNAGLVGKDLEYTLADCAPEVLVVDAENYPKLDAIAVQQRRRLRTYVVGVDPRSGDRPFADLVAASTAESLPDTTPEQPAIILYTGGTTGLPKGVVLTQFSLILAGVRYGETFAVKAGERHFTTLPLFHAAAQQFGVMGPLVNDMTTVIDRRFSAGNYWNRVRSTGANVIDPIGSMLGVLNLQPPSPDDRAHAVRVGIGIFGQVPPAVPQAFSARFGIPLVSIYGLTEAGGAMITSDRLPDQVPGSNGKTHGWAELRIADGNDLPVATGTVGQILLRPTLPHMFMLGYHNNPEKTLQSFRNLWLQTGDLGRLDEAGNLYFVGRQAHWIRRGGENVSAFEIEQILSGMPMIAEVVVVGVPSEIGEDDIKAFIITADNATVDPVAVVEWCRARMAPFKVPRYVEFVADFPRSVTKREIERAILKKMPNAGAWDREKAMGRLSSQSGGAHRAIAAVSPPPQSSSR
jgi:crotonobetaine/carnitine-CoA ligase